MDLPLNRLKVAHLFKVAHSLNLSSVKNLNCVSKVKKPDCDRDLSDCSIHASPSQT
jgi:hypothetical protein